MIQLRIARSLEEGRSLLLAQRGLHQLVVPAGIAKRTLDTFGEALTPSQVVERIVSAVRSEGDAALERYSRLIDGAFHRPLQLKTSAIKAARSRLPAELLSALEVAAERILDFHRKAVRRSWIDPSLQGVFGQLVAPLARVGLYVPGGRAAYPSSLLMSALPARAAGVAEVIVATPPSRDGAIPDVVLAAADIAGVASVYRIGGAQAIAAMAYGTESIPRVDKIVGPGNIFVALAKRMVSDSAGIDALTGPTETVIVADEHARLETVAADLLAQAEHDPLAQPVLLTTAKELVQRLPGELERQLALLPEENVARESLEGRGVVVLVESLAEAMRLANEYAPEHLCLSVDDPWSLLDSVRSAGGVFLGEQSAEALGDYVAGPSHVMPTGGTARFSSPLTVDDFLKVTSLFATSPQGLEELGPAAMRIARAEGLDAHAESLRRRLEERQTERPERE